MSLNHINSNLCKPTQSIENRPQTQARHRSSLRVGLSRSLSLSFCLFVSEAVPVPVSASVRPIKMQELLMRDIKIHYYYIRLLLLRLFGMPIVVAIVAVGITAVVNLVCLLHANAQAKRFERFKLPMDARRASAVSRG